MDGRLAQDELDTLFGIDGYPREASTSRDIAFAKIMARVEGTALGSHQLDV